DLDPSGGVPERIRLLRDDGHGPLIDRRVDELVAVPARAFEGEENPARRDLTRVEEQARDLPLQRAREAPDMDAFDEIGQSHGLSGPSSPAWAAAIGTAGSGTSSSGRSGSIPRILTACFAIDWKTGAATVPP